MSSKKEIGANKPPFINTGEYFSTILELAPCHIFWKNKESVFLGCNRLFANAAKLNSPEDIIGKTDYDLHWAKEEADRYREDDRFVMQNKTPKLSVEESQTFADGSKITLLTNKVPFYDRDGNVMGVVGVYQDITAIKDVQEKAEAASLAKTEFIANMSHDIRTPLAGMLGLTDILLDMEGTTEKKTYLTYLRQSTQQLLSLLNGVLDVVSADKSSDENIHLSSFSLRESMEHIRELFLPTLVQKNINFQIKIAENVPAFIITDRTKIERIFLNLLANAIKFTEKGQVNFEAKWKTEKEHQYYLEIDVIDTGIGIPAEQQSKIFDQFFKVNPSYNGIYKGHGIGLYLVKQFVEALNGDIQLQSILGKGTHFTCLIPIKTTEQLPTDFTEKVESTIQKHNLSSLLNSLNVSNNHSEAKITSYASQSSKLTKVLLVEDDLVVFIAENSLLKSKGCQVDHAATGAEALELLDQHHYDLILMDVGLPDFSGLEVTHQFRALEAQRKNSHEKSPIPIVGLTAHTTQEAQKTCLVAGMQHVIIKPLTAIKIDDILKKYGPSEETNVSENAKYYLRAEDLPDEEQALFELDNILIFDEALALSRTGDHETLTMLLNVFLNEALPSDKKQFALLYEKKNWDAIADLAHKLKGSCLYCGTERLYAAAKYMERYWKAGYRNEEVLNKLYLQVLTMIEKTEEAVRQVN